MSQPEDGNAPVLSVRDLHKRFGSVDVLQGIDLEIPRARSWR